RALALAEIDGQRKTAITGMLDRLDLAEAHVDLETDIHADADIDLAGAPGPTAPEDVFGQCRQPIQFGAAVVAIGDCLFHALSFVSDTCLPDCPTGSGHCAEADVRRPDR